jgi:hypothetical protein
VVENVGTTRVQVRLDSGRERLIRFENIMSVVQ